MLKASKPLSTETVATYFKKELTAAESHVYYRESEQGKNTVGEWHGKLAEERFGLAAGSSVEELQYTRLALGQHPITGEQLIKHRPPADPNGWTKSGVAWRNRLEGMFQEALVSRQDVFRVPRESEWRVKAPVPQRPAAVELKITPDKPAPGMPVPKPSVRPGAFDANTIPVTDLWRDLGGPTLKGNRGTAFWRDGDGLNVQLYPKTNTWKDFAHDDGGGTVLLAAKALGVTPKEAWEHLQKTYGQGGELPRPAVQEKPEPKPVDQTRREKLIEMHAIAAGVFRENLAAPACSKAQEYLRSRGVGDGSREKFGLGYSAVVDQLRARLESYGPDLMDASGLFWRDKGGRFHDRFRDRLMFPIQNRKGQVVAFAGRRLDQVEEGKYINSRETEIYKKGETIYNFHRADAAGTGRVVGVEGYLDVIAADAAGVPDVIALSGTSMSRNQAQQIASIASDVVMNLDPDKAGRQASVKCMETLHGAGVQVRSLDLEDDPAAYLQAYGAKAYRNEVDNAKPVVEWLAARAKEQFDVADPYQRADAVKWMVSQLENVPANQRSRMCEEVSRYLKVDLPIEEKPKHKEHVSAIDFTVAPNKSYSAAALVGGDQRIVEWHKIAIRETADAIEEYVQARMRDIGAVTTANWAAAIFTHDTARPVNGNAPNPHLHSHILGFNMTELDEKVRSMFAQELYRIQSYGTAIYQAKMAMQALAGGYQLGHGRNGSTCIQGFSDAYLEAISARSKEIEEEKARLGIVGAEADEIVNKKLRQPKKEWDPAALREEHKRQAAEFVEIQNVAEIEGNGSRAKRWLLPEEIVSEAKARVGQRLSPLAKSVLADQAITHARERLQESQAVNDKYEIIRDSLKFGLGKIELADVLAALDQRKEFVQVSHYRENAPGARYTTESMRQIEVETIRIVLSGKGKVQPIAAGLTREKFRELYKSRHVDGRKIELNDQQLWMAYRCLTTPDQFMLVAGAAGAGKSTAMKPIAELAVLSAITKQHRVRGYEVRGLASTSGAANNLAEIGIQSETLQAHNQRGVDASEKPLVYVVDEGSLAGTRQLNRFVKTVRAQDRVIIVYDPRQHQSVEAGRIVEELEEAGLKAFRLEKIVRQKCPELAAVIDTIKSPAKDAAVLGIKKLKEVTRTSSGIHEIKDRNKRLQYMAMFYVKDPNHTLMVAPDNKTIGELNMFARSDLAFNGKLSIDVYEAKVLIGARGVREADRQVAVTYEPGNILRWGRRVDRLGVGKGEYTEVLRVNAEANTVTIRAAVGEVTYNPREAFGVEIFNSGVRQLAIGEKIQLTRPWRERRLANRAVGTIERLDKKGNARVRMKDGRVVNWLITEMPHIEYAYAMTSYSLQYATDEKVLLHLDCGDSRIRKLMDKALLYVGLSRGASEMHIFTDSEAELLGQNSPIQRVTVKPKALSRQEIQSIGIAS